MQRCQCAVIPTRRRFESARPSRASIRRRTARWVTALFVGFLSGSLAQSATAGTTIFRCPGKPAVYTSDARLASSLGCESLDRRSVVVASPAPTSARESLPVSALSADAKPASLAMLGAPSKANVIPRAVQLERDDDRKRILQDELARDRSKLQALIDALSKARVQDGGTEVERIGQAIRRKEADIEALSRELVLAGR